MRFFSSIKQASETRPRGGAARIMREDDKLESTVKRSARRRLIGALVLVCIMVVALPLIFDATPKAPEPELVIAVSPSPVVSTSSPQPVNQHEAVGSMTSKTNAAAGMPTPPSKLPSQSAMTVPGKHLVHGQITLSGGEEIVASTPKLPGTLSSAADKNAASAAKGTDSKAPSAGSAKVFLKAGAFASEERALNWLNKLKAAKLPAKIDYRKTPEGERHFLRVGPFEDRTLAEAAQKKVQALGLPSIINESH